MKSLKLLTGIVFFTATLSYCTNPSKLTTNKSKTKDQQDKFFYLKYLVPIIEVNCSPCHFPSKGGSKKPYDNYEKIKADIDEIIRRIELDTTDSKFMPRKRLRLKENEIELFKNLKSTGVLQH